MNALIISDARIKKAVQFVAEESPHRVLDIGCSQGNISSIIGRRGIQVVGMDLNICGLIDALQNNILAVKANASALFPFKDNSFDCIFAGEIVEHIMDTDFFLDETRRMLVKNGTLVITTPNLANLENRLRLLIGRYPLFIDYTSRGDNHIRAYTLRALIRQLKARGFVIEKKTGSFLPFLSHFHFKLIASRLMPILSEFGSLFPGLAVHIVIKARKQ